MRKTQKLALLPDLPEVLSDGYTFDAFSTLIRRQRLDVIEKTLALESPCDGFREWLVRVLWRFYCNSGKHVWNSRNVLKEALSDSTRLAKELKVSAHLLWLSSEPSVIEALSDLVEWQAWQSLRPMHPSGILWIALLDEFVRRTDRLGTKLPVDKGAANSTTMASSAWCRRATSA